MPNQDTDASRDSSWHQQTICASGSSTNSTSRLSRPETSTDSLHQSGLEKHKHSVEEDVTATDCKVTTPSLWNSSRRDKLILLGLALCNILIFMCLAIMAPFYPKEANGRGVSDTISGFVFGIFSLIQFATSPVFGKLIPVVGAKVVFVLGMFFAGGSCILFGALDYFPRTDEGRLSFIVYSFVLRTAMSIGCTAASTAAFAICAFTFPQNAAMTLGFLETFTGIGLMLGPALGGVLYDLGGFLTPFATVGALLIVSVPLYMWILPAGSDVSQHEDVPISTLLKDPIFFVTCIGVVLGAVTWVVLDPTLEPHLRQFDLDSSLVGLVFLMLSSAYAITSPLWGWVADKMSNSSPLIILGFYVNAVSMLLLGPSPLLGLEDYQHLWLNIVALLVTGISISLAVVPTFDRCIVIAEKSGLEMNLGTHSAIAGVWMCCYALGEFIGPTAAGALVDSVGFGWTTTYISGSSAFAGTMILALWLYETRCKKGAHLNTPDIITPPEEVSEKSPLIPKQRASPCYPASDSEGPVMPRSRRKSRQWYPAIAGRSMPQRHKHMGRQDNSDTKKDFNRSYSIPNRRTKYTSTGYETV